MTHKRHKSKKYQQYYGEPYTPKTLMEVKQCRKCGRTLKTAGSLSRCPYCGGRLQTKMVPKL